MRDPVRDLTAFRASLVEKRRVHVQRYSKVGPSGVNLGAVIRMTELQEAVDAVDRALADESRTNDLGSVSRDD